MNRVAGELLRDGPKSVYLFVYLLPTQKEHYDVTPPPSLPGQAIPGVIVEQKVTGKKVTEKKKKKN